MQIEIRKKVALYASLMSFFMACLYNVIRGGLEFQWYESLVVLGFAFTLFNLPIVLAEIEIERFSLKSKLWKDEYVLTFLLLVFTCLVGVISLSIGYLFSVIGILAFLRNVSTSSNKLNWYDAVSLVFVTVITVWVCLKVWDGHYTHPLLLEMVPFDNKLHLDTWFHVSITQMIKTYQVPTTGLNGLPFIHYHFGSHLIFALISKALDVHAFTFYQLAFPVVFIPLFFKVVLTLPVAWAERQNREYQIGIWFWLILAFGLVGVFPNWLLQNAASNWNAFASSESHCVSLTFFFLLIHVIFGHFDTEKTMAKFEIVIFCLLVLILGLLKISTLFMFDVLFGYLFLRLKLFRKKSNNLLFLLVALISVACLAVGLDRYSENDYVAFHFFKTFVKTDALRFILIYYFWSLVLVVILVILNRVRKPGDNSFHRILLEAVVVICVAGALPGAILNIHGGSAGLFMDVHLWFSLAFLLVILPDVIGVVKGFYSSYRHKQRIIIIWVSIIILCGWHAYRNFRYYRINFVQTTDLIYHSLAGKSIDPKLLTRNISGLLKNQTRLQPQIDSTLTSNPHYKILLSLYRLDSISLAEKSRTLVVSDPAMLSQKYPCNIYPFMIPALTGMAMTDGYHFENCIYHNYYYEYYSAEKLQEDRAKKTGFSLSEIKISRDGVTVNLR
jgi:hypothetical protein